MPSRVHHHPDLIYSAGTQVVLVRDALGDGGRVLHPRGAVGVVIRAPRDLEHAYRIRFPDGVEASLPPQAIMTLARFKEGEIGDAAVTAARSDLFARVIYRCVTGSRAYGLAH